jgi:hypothetical protein
MPDPVIIIPTLGRSHLRDAVQSIDIDARICVIANGGHDFGWLPDDAWLIDLPGNIGYAAAVNLGIKCYLHEPFWIVMNDDIVLAPGDLQRLIDTDGYGWVGINDWSVQKLTEDAVERVGFMDESFSPAYVDDADYERRCDLAGVRRGFIKGETTHAGSACLRVHRSDNARSYPLNVQHHLDKWGVGVRAPGGWEEPATPPVPSLSHLRARAWRPDR